MAVRSRDAGLAVGLSLGAAFLWAAYYPLVLGVRPSTLPSGLLVLPFLVGGLAFAAAALLERHARPFRSLWKDPAAWGRGLLLAVMQIGVLAATYLSGPVDTALLSLVGDVVVTPFLLATVYREGGARFRSAGFVGGIAACAGGASLTILAGGSARPLSGLAIPVALGVPFLIAFYFLAMARTIRSQPTSAVAAQATLVAALATLALAPTIPGGIGGIEPPTIPAAGAAVAIGLTAFYVAPSLYFRAIGRAGIVLPSVLMATIPIFTLFFAWGVLGAVPPPFALLGIPIAVVGAFAALRGEPATAATPPEGPANARGPGDPQP